MKLPKIIKDCAAYCVGAYTEFSQALQDVADYNEMKNKVASLSDYRFADAFFYTANRIAASRTAPNKETLRELCDKAMEMLASGTEQAEVLWYFDILLEKAPDTEKEQNHVT